MKYAPDCNKLMTNSDEGQMIWSTHMALAQPVSQEEFEMNCNGEGLLDEGETFADFCFSDPDHGFYKCETPHGEVFFLQQSGFEFFFTQDGRPPSFFLPEHHVDTLLVQREGFLATTLLAAGDGRIQGRNDAEHYVKTLPEGVEVIQGRDTRFRMMVDGEAVAGLKIQGNLIIDLFVRGSMRRQGLASRLIEIVEAHYGTLIHNSSLTDDGKAFVSSLSVQEPLELDSPTL